MINVIKKIINKIKHVVFSKTQESRFTNHYQDWRQKRIEYIIDKVGKKNFTNLSILELGCGYGQIGLKLRELGAKVTFSDARVEHLKEIRKAHPDVKIVVANLENEWPFEQKFDIIINFGVLYHLNNPDFLIRKCCENCDIMFLETEVSDSSADSYIIQVDESGYDQAFCGMGCRPSGAYVERLIQLENKKFEQLQDSSCNSGYHTYDWEITESGDWRHGLRRMWYISS